METILSSAAKPRRPSFFDGLTDAQLLSRVAAFYRHRLAFTPSAQSILADWGLSPETWTAFALGVADGDLAGRLTDSLPPHLVRLGVLTRSGRDVLDGCIVVPLHGPRGDLHALCGLPMDGNPERSIRFGPDGFVNMPALRSTAPLCLEGSLRHVLSAWERSERTTTCLPGPLQSWEDLKPLLEVWKGYELRLGPSLRLDNATLHSLASELQVRGVYVTQASSDGSAPHRIPGHSLDTPLWQARFDDYLVLRNYRERSREAMRVEVRWFFEHLHSQQVDNVVNLTPVHVESYRLALFYVRHRGQRLSLNTQAHRLGAVKAFTRFLYQAGWTLTDPGASVPTISVPRRLPEVWLSETEVTQLLETPPLDNPLAVRNRAILETFYSTALRSSELCQLTLDVVDLRAQELRIRHGKGGRTRLLPLGEEAAHWLLRYLDEVRPTLATSASGHTLFLTMRGQAFCRITLAVMVRNTADRAGLSKHVSPHVLRHACATHMLRRGANLRYVQALLGHASPSTTQLYTRVDITDLRTMHARFHPRGRG